MILATTRNGGHIHGQLQNGLVARPTEREQRAGITTLYYTPPKGDK